MTDMPSAPTLGDAIALAAYHHREQLYHSPAPEPYILHPLRVMLAVETEAERIVAVLHDVVEDTDLTLDDLCQRGYSEEVVAAVDHLTHRDGVPYTQYIESIVGDPLARRVKLADLSDNLANNQVLEPTPVRRERIARYEAAQRRLIEASQRATGH